MAIERAALADAEILALIHAASFPASEAWSSDVFRLQLVLPGIVGLVDRAGGVVLLRTAADEAEILTLAVSPAARRRGIATALLGSATEVSKSQGAQALFLEVSTENQAARALYRRAGFRTVGRRHQYYADRSDALVLRLDLTAATALHNGRGNVSDSDR